ncbi:MAG TPA: hypothetical protein VGF40_16920 [Thermoanaerobaculia bacterium]
MIPQASTTGFLFPIAAITLMLWLMWSESLRARTRLPAAHLFRALLYLGISGVMIFNGWRYRHALETANFVLLAAAALVGLIGAVFFAKKARRG